MRFSDGTWIALLGSRYTGGDSGSRSSRGRGRDRRGVVAILMAVVVEGPKSAADWSRLVLELSFFGSRISDCGSRFVATSECECRPVVPEFGAQKSRQPSLSRIIVIGS